jgi:hypothetical protein
MNTTFGEVSTTDNVSGVWDGLSTQEAKERYPDEWERFLADPYAHRAPRAESYHDLSGELVGSCKMRVLGLLPSSCRANHI